MTDKNVERKLFNGALFVVNAMEELREYSEMCEDDETRKMILSMIDGLKNMGNALCDLADNKFGNALKQKRAQSEGTSTFADLNSKHSIPDEVKSYIKEIKEEIRKGKENE